MSNRLRSAAVAIEAAVTFTLLAASLLADGGVRVRHVVVGFAFGFVYRHSRAVAGCRRFRERPLRSVSIALTWIAVSVAADRSLRESAARRGFGAGFGLGSVAYRAVRR